MEQVILVDQDDNEIGVCEKLDAHKLGKLHRAFSVFVFDERGALLIQQRAKSKYHTSGLWTNTCDGHPRPGETTSQAARRRLLEEMGFECELAEAFAFTYHANLGDHLVEHEYDHVLVGRFSGTPVPDSTEAGDWKWVDMETLAEDMREHPDRYAPWFRIAREKILPYLRAAS